MVPRSSFFPLFFSLTVEPQGDPLTCPTLGSPFRHSISVTASHLHCTAGSSKSFTAIRKDAGLCCRSRLRSAEVCAYVGSIQNLKDLKVKYSGMFHSPSTSTSLLKQGRVREMAGNQDFVLSLKWQTGRFEGPAKGFLANPSCRRARCLPTLGALKP